MTPLDRRDFDGAVRAARAYFDRYQDPGPLGEFFDGDAHPGLLEAHIDITSDEFLRLPRVNDDLTLVKCPKGTGKTECLRGILANYPSVLLVGRRRAPIRQSCTRLNLACYPSASAWTASRDWRTATGRYPSTPSSSTNPSRCSHTSCPRRCHRVARSEGGHEIEGWPQPRRHLTILRALLRRARRVIALDADLDESPKASAFGERVAAGVPRTWASCGPRSV
jgi:hypothetical protein